MPTPQEFFKKKACCVPCAVLLLGSLAHLVFGGVPNVDRPIPNCSYPNDLTHRLSWTTGTEIETKTLSDNIQF
jgi:hypothetical protein